MKLQFKWNILATSLQRLLIFILWPHSVYHPIRYLDSVHTSRRSLRLSQRARPLQVAAKIWKIFYLATVYRRSQQIRSVV